MGREKVLGKRHLVYRYPRVFILVGITLSMSVLFNKAIFDVYQQSKIAQEEKAVIDKAIIDSKA